MNSLEKYTGEIILHEPGSLPGRQIPDFKGYNSIYGVDNIGDAISSLSPNYVCERIDTHNGTIFEIFGSSNGSGSELQGGIILEIDRVTGKLVTHEMSPLKAYIERGLEGEFVFGIHEIKNVVSAGAMNAKKHVQQHFQGFY